MKRKELARPTGEEGWLARPKKGEEGFLLSSEGVAFSKVASETLLAATMRLYDWLSVKLILPTVYQS